MINITPQGICTNLKTQPHFKAHRATMLKFIITFLLFTCITPSSSVVIEVDGKHSDKSNCLKQMGPPCHSLEYVAEHMSNSSSLTVLITASSLTVHSVVNISHINITGYNKMSTEITCATSVNRDSDGAALIFFNCSNVMVSGFTISNCGGRETNDLSVQSILVKSTKDVIVKEIAVTNGTGHGLSFQNVKGEVSILDSNFSYNKHRSYNDYEEGVGGMLILYNSTYTGEYVTQVTYTIANCTFINNAANLGLEDWDANSNHGGGLSLVLSNCNQVAILVTMCYFSQNKAVFAGGLSVLHTAQQQRNRIIIKDTIFYNNVATYGGGGADIGFLTDDHDKYPNDTTVVFHNCSFTNNKASFGGGAGIYVTAANAELNHALGNNITFTNCSFQNNTADGGAAIDISHVRLHKIGNLFISNIFFCDCSFISNIAGSHIPYQESNNTIQGGIIFISDVCATFTNQMTFQNNKGAALYVSSSTIKFHYSNVNFYSNIGSAILLVGNAYLEIDEFNNFTFIENTASYGGAIRAIQLQNRNNLFLERCFVKPVDVNTSFYFANNKATTGIGDDMFIYNLLPCLDFCGRNHHDFNVSMLFTRNCIGTFTFTNQSVATTPFKLKAKSPIFLYPGVEHKLELQQLDQFSSDVGKIFPVTANIRNGSARIASGHVIAFNNSIRIIGTPNTISTLIIETNILTEIKVAVQVIMSDCSPGFVFNKENQSCQCSAWNDNTSYNGIPYCKHEALLNIGF